MKNRIKNWKLFLIKEGIEDFKYTAEEIEDYFLHLKESGGYHVTVGIGYKSGSSKYLASVGSTNRGAKSKIAYKISIRKNLVTTGSKLPILKDLSETIGSVYKDVTDAIKKLPFNFKQTISFSLKRNLFWIDIILVETDETGKEKVSVDEFKLLKEELTRISHKVENSRYGNKYHVIDVNSYYNNVYYNDANRPKKIAFDIDFPPKDTIYVMPHSYTYGQSPLTRDEMIKHYKSIIDRINNIKSLDAIYFDYEIIDVDAKNTNSRNVNERGIVFKLPILKVRYFEPDYSFVDKHGDEMENVEDELEEKED